MRTIEMNFLPDVYVKCETCNGKRYNRETLEIRFKGKSINDVLDMPIDEAVKFFENTPQILRKIEALHDVGLGYITLGQQSTTLSGGEAQRVKLATELSKRDTGNTFYILDEPTTGLDPAARLLVWQKLRYLRDQGVTLILTTHYMEEAAQLCDRLVVMDKGRILAEGTPEVLVQRLVGYEVIELRQDKLGVLADREVLGSLIANRPIVLEEAGDTLYLFGQQPDAFHNLTFPLLDYQLKRKTGLEDVFLRLTGRGLSEGETDE